VVKQIEESPKTDEVINNEAIPMDEETTPMDEETTNICPECGEAFEGSVPQVKCDSCGLWVHIKCSGKNEEFLNKSSTIFCCQKCLLVVSNNKPKPSSLKRNSTGVMTPKKKTVTKRNKSPSRGRQTSPKRLRNRSISPSKYYSPRTRSEDVAIWREARSNGKDIEKSPNRKSPNTKSPKKKENSKENLESNNDSNVDKGDNKKLNPEEVMEVEEAKEKEKVDDSAEELSTEIETEHKIPTLSPIAKILKVKSSKRNFSNLEKDSIEHDDDEPPNKKAKRDDESDEEKEENFEEDKESVSKTPKRAVKTPKKTPRSIKKVIPSNEPLIVEAITKSIADSKDDEFIEDGLRPKKLDFDNIMNSSEDKKEQESSSLNEISENKSEIKDKNDNITIENGSNKIDVDESNEDMQIESPIKPTSEEKRDKEAEKQKEIIDAEGEKRYLDEENKKVAAEKKRLEDVKLNIETEEKKKIKKRI